MLGDPLRPRFLRRRTGAVRHRLSVRPGRRSDVHPRRDCRARPPRVAAPRARPRLFPQCSGAGGTSSGVTDVSRSERLLALIQVLRRHRRPVSGADLAREMSVSVRTIYRDIQSLVAGGAPIDGEAGVGYVMRPGFTLPPLMFTEEEVEVIVLGSRMVAASTDARLADAARDALAKITAVLPDGRADDVAALGLLSAPRP